MATFPVFQYYSCTHLTSITSVGRKLKVLQPPISPPHEGDSRGPPHEGDSRGPPHAGDSRGPPHVGDSRGPPHAGDSRGPPHEGDSRGAPHEGVEREPALCLVRSSGALLKCHPLPPIRLPLPPLSALPLIPRSPKTYPSKHTTFPWDLTLLDVCVIQWRLLH